MLLIKQTLLQFGINFDQVHAITADNAATMHRAVNVAKLFQTHLIDDYLSVFENELKKDNFLQQMKAYNKFIETELKRHASILQEGNTAGKLVHEIHCAVHTFQLAVTDTIEQKSFVAPIIEEAREMVKILRTNNVLNLIAIKELPKPKLDCKTRWGSTFEMLQSLCALKGFCAEMAMIDDKYLLSDDFWDLLDPAMKVLEYAYTAVKNLQKDDLVLSDVYGILFVLKKRLEFHLEKKPNDELAKTLKANVEKRESDILNTNCMYSCMFLDPRYQIMLDDDQKKAAISHLADLYEKIQAMSGNKNAENTIHQMTAGENVADTFNDSMPAEPDDSLLGIDILEMEIRRKYSSQGVAKQNDINAVLEAFSFTAENRLHSNANIFEFWRQNRYSRPELYQLSKVIFSIFATEVVSEKHFSTLAFILNRLRNRLTDDALEQIMFIKLNEDLFLKN